MLKKCNLIEYVQHEQGNKNIRRFVNKFNQGIRIVMSDGGWNNHHMDEVAPQVIQWGVRGLWLDRNLNPLIITRIVHIHFHSLQSLVLYHNHIESVECLSRLKAPVLTGLSLISNYVSEASSLRKLNCPELTILQLGSNKIKQMEWSSQLRAPLNNISIQYEADLSRCSNVSWLMKLQTIQLSTINFQGIGMIKCSKMKSVANTRYKQIFDINSQDTI